MTGPGDAETDFAPWLARWGLTPDGEPIVSRAGRLLPVRDAAGEPLMLKISREPEERRGARLMEWWAGDGAARVLALEDDALVLERAVGDRLLTAMARGGRDDDATRIVCATAAALHAPREFVLPPNLVPLDRWFADLWPAANVHGGMLARCAETARTLLDDPQDMVVLHGDLHHGNVLDFGSRDWLAIDPKGLYGQRCFDFANLLCNPDLELACAPGRLARQASVAAAAASLDREQLLRWVVAWAGLSAVWSVADGDAETLDLSLAAIAAEELDR